MVDPLARVPLVIGHRGASGYRPEHTASAYRLAAAQGVDAVEPDVVVTRDGVLVVRHENEISGTTDVADHPEFAARRTTKVVDGERLTGWFTEDFTWAELQTLRCRERVPHLRAANAQHDGLEPLLSLRDVLGLVDQESSAREMPIIAVIELKHAHYFSGLGWNLAALLIAELTAAGWADRPQQLIIESFELGVLDRLRAAGVRGSLVFLTETTGVPADERATSGEATHSWAWYRSDDGLHALQGRVDGISVAKADLLTPGGSGHTDLVTRAHARGLQVYTWTLRPENAFLDRAHRSSADTATFGDWRTEWKRVCDSGVDGIFVDHPDLARQLLD